MVNQARLFSLFTDLCRINAPALAEGNCVKHVKALLKQMGMEVWEDEAGAKIGGKANNLVARLKENASGFPSIFLSAHFDTVEPTQDLSIQETDELFRTESDTILGADNKAGMAPAIEAVQCIIEQNLPHGEIWLLFSVAEEIGLKGAAAMDLDQFEVDFGYVLDTGPPVGSFVTRTGTHDQLDVTITGKPAHSGKDPENGINAIKVVADAVSQMKVGRIGEELTANIGIIHGGTAVNVVCPEVKLRCEARGTSPSELRDQVDHMIGLFEASARKFGAKAFIEHRRHYEGYNIAEDAPVVRRAVEASKALGFDPLLRTTLGGSDANIFNAKGVPSAVMATGMQKIHTHEEFCTKQDLVDTARLALQILAG